MVEVQVRSGNVRWMLMVMGGMEGRGKGQWKVWRNKEGQWIVAIGQLWSSSVWVGSEWELQ